MVFMGSLEEVQLQITKGGVCDAFGYVCRLGRSISVRIVVVRALCALHDCRLSQH